MRAQYSQIEERGCSSADFEVFFRRYQPQLLAYSRARFGGLDADEITSETMTRAFESFSLLDRKRSPWPWMQVVARRIATDMYRARAVCPPTLDAVFAEIPNEPACSTEEQVIAREQTQMMGRTLQLLSDADRSFLRLRLVDELSHKEIAHLLGTTTSAARQQYHRACARFVTCFKTLGGEVRALVPFPILATLWKCCRRASGTQVGTITPALLQTTATLGTLAVGPLGMSLLPVASPPTAPRTATVMSASTPTPVAFFETHAAGQARPSITSITSTALDTKRTGHAGSIDVQAGAEAVSAEATVARKPFAPGKSEVHYIGVSTSVGTVYVWGDGSNSGPTRVLCLTPGLDCG